MNEDIIKDAKGRKIFLSSEMGRKELNRFYYTYFEIDDIWSLGKPTFQKSAVFLNIVQKAFDPPPLLFEHLSYFAGGVFSCGEFFK